MKILKILIFSFIIVFSTLVSSCSAEQKQPTNVYKFCVIPGDVFLIDWVRIRYGGSFSDNSYVIMHSISVSFKDRYADQIFVRDGKMVRLEENLIISIKEQDGCLLITKINR